MDICSYGAVGDGMTINTRAIQKAIDQCSAAGGGRVLVSAGRFLTGTLIIKNNVELYLAHNAVLLGSTNPAHYPLQPESTYTHRDTTFEGQWRCSTRRDTITCPLYGNRPDRRPGRGMESRRIRSSRLL